MSATRDKARASDRLRLGTVEGLNGKMCELLHTLLVVQKCKLAKKPHGILPIVVLSEAKYTIAGICAAALRTQKSEHVRRAYPSMQIVKPGTA